ncbi:hypothetical protein ACVRG4_005637, partial [Escherichia coli]
HETASPEASITSSFSIFYIPRTILFSGISGPLSRIIYTAMTTCSSAVIISPWLRGFSVPSYTAKAHTQP